MELLRIDHWAAGQQGQEELERKANSDLWRIQCESYHDLSWDVHKRSCFKEGERGYPKNVFFRLFPIISLSQKFLIIFFLTLEKIGIDEKVICYHNISNLLWKKMFFVFGNKNESQKNYKFSAFRPRICKLFSRFTFFSSH